MSAGYVLSNVAAIALVAATPKTVLQVLNATNGMFRIPELSVSFDGVTATAVPVLIELMKNTNAGAGTFSTATIVQFRGATRAVQSTGLYAYTVEPTVLTRVKHWLVRPDSPPFVVQFPLGREPEQLVTVQGYCLRITAPAVVNCHAYMEFEEG